MKTGAVSLPSETHRDGVEPSEPQSKLRQLIVGIALTALFSILAILLAYPDLSTLQTHVPGDYADGHFYQWNLFWDLNAISGPAKLLDANIYWPNKGTLAYSDPLVAPSLAMWPLIELLGYPAGYGLTYLLGWLASLVGMYLLSKQVIKSRLGSILAAIIYTFAPPRLVHYLHFQLVIGGALIPFVVYFLVRTLNESRWWQACALGLTLGLIGLTSAYYALFLSAFLPIVLAIWSVIRRRFSLRLALQLATAAALLAAVIAPLAPGYLQVQRDEYFRRGIESPAAPMDFLAPAGHSYFYKALDRKAEADGRGIENRLFPGFVAMTLAAVGVFALRKSSSVSTDRTALLALTVGGLVALVLSLGRTIELMGRFLPLPYIALAKWAPGFASIRAPSRFAVLALLALAILAGAGFGLLARGRWGPVLALVLISMMVTEYAIRIDKVPAVTEPSFTRVNLALARKPPGAVLELPMGDPRSFWWGYVEAPRMVLSRIDWKPRVNGYSGFHPPGYTELVFSMNSLASRESTPETVEQGLVFIDTLQVRYVVARTAPIAQFAPGSDEASFAAYDEGAILQLGTSLGDRVLRSEILGAAVLFELKPPG